MENKSIQKNNTTNSVRNIIRASKKRRALAKMAVKTIFLEQKMSKISIIEN